MKLLLSVALLLLSCHASHGGNRGSRSMMRDDSDGNSNFLDFVSGLGAIYPVLVQHLSDIQATEAGANIVSAAYAFETALAQAADEAGLSWTFLQGLCSNSATSITCQCWNAPTQQQTVSADTNWLSECRPVKCVCSY